MPMLVFLAHNLPIVSVGNDTSRACSSHPAAPKPRPVMRPPSAQTRVTYGKREYPRLIIITPGAPSCALLQLP